MNTHKKNNSNINNGLYKSNADGEVESAYKSEPMFKHITMILIKLFSEHNLKPDDKFDKNVWFLRNNAEYQRFIQETKTLEGPYNDFMKIIQDCSSNGKNLKNFSIEVRTFVNEISKHLFEANVRRSNADEMVKHYKMDEMKESILDKIAKERQNLEFLGDMTEIKFSIDQMENFPEGNYGVNLNCDAFLDTDGPRIATTEIKTRLVANKRIIINSMNIDQPFFTPEYMDTIFLRNEKNFEYLNLDEVSLSKSKFNSDVCYIGILLNSFRFWFYKDETFFALSESETMIDIFINSLDLLLKDRPFKCSSSSYATIDKSNAHLVKSGMDKKYVVYFDIEINFNKKTKLLVLEKIFSIFHDTITAKYDNEKFIENILEYFPEAKNDIKAVFNERKNINSDKCACNNCLIF